MCADLYLLARPAGAEQTFDCVGTRDVQLKLTELAAPPPVYERTPTSEKELLLARARSLPQSRGGFRVYGNLKALYSLA